MTDTGVQINWGATTAADAVASMRQAMASRPAAPFWQRSVYLGAVPGPAAAAASPPIPRPQYSIAGASTRTVKLKKLRTLGGSAGLPGLYAIATAILVVAGVVGIWQANSAFAPEMYGDGLVPAAEALSQGQNYAVFDLNINIRKLRDEQVKRFAELEKHGMKVLDPSETLANDLHAFGEAMAEDWKAKAGEAGKAVLDAYAK